MHARRNFVKALDAGDERAALIIGNFKYLYQVEEEVRDASDEERLALRRERSTPCYRDMIDWCRLPWRLRYAMGYDRRLCADILNVFIRSRCRWLRWRTKRKL